MSLSTGLRVWQRQLGAFRERHPKAARLDQHLGNLLWAILSANLAVIMVRELDGSHAVQLVTFCATVVGTLSAFLIGEARSGCGEDDDEDRDERHPRSANGSNPDRA